MITEFCFFETYFPMMNSICWQYFMEGKKLTFLDLEFKRTK